MPKQIALVKTPHGFAYATDSDKEKASSWKVGQALNCEIKQWSARSLQHHKLYWGGLLELAIDYWEPPIDLTTESEKALIRKYSKLLDEYTDGGFVSEFGEEFLQNLSKKRSQNIEMPHKSKSDLHEWIKDKANYVDVIVTPSGIKRVTKSINFNAMSQEQFNDYYKKAFNVCWTFILSQSFDDDVKCQQAIDQLLSMGG